MFFNLYHNIILQNTKMIDYFSFRNLRNSEYYQFMVSALDVFGKNVVVREQFGCLLDSLSENLIVAELALSAERKSEKVREKNEADRYRDRLHSKLFNYLKSILYDERDPRFEAAQEVMRVVKEAGNPTRLAENAQSAMMTALGNKLAPLSEQLDAINAKQMVDEMMDANRQFIEAEKELREMIASQILNDTPLSVTAVRKQTDPVYRSLVAGVNVFSKTPSKKEACSELITKMNVLIARYDALLAARKREKKE